jgi:hypothetical protein
MKSTWEVAIDAVEQEKEELRSQNIINLQYQIIEIVKNMYLPFNKELFIDIIIDLKKENGSLPR